MAEKDKKEPVKAEYKESGDKGKVGPKTKEGFEAHKGLYIGGGIALLLAIAFYLYEKNKNSSAAATTPASTTTAATPSGGGSSGWGNNGGNANGGSTPSSTTTDSYNTTTDSNNTTTSPSTGTSTGSTIFNGGGSVVTPTVPPVTPVSTGPVDPAVLAAIATTTANLQKDEAGSTPADKAAVKALTKRLATLNATNASRVGATSQVHTPAMVGGLGAMGTTVVKPAASVSGGTSTISTATSTAKPVKVTAKDPALLSKK